MRKSKSYFKKGFYDHRQAQGLPVVKQFIVTESKGKRCLLLRFENETELDISCLKFILTQLDTSGKIIGVDAFEYKDISFRPGTVYSRGEGIVIADECADFTVDILYAVSGKYKYVSKNNGTAVVYDIRGYNTRSIIGDHASKARIKRKMPGIVFYGFLAFIAVLLLTLACYLTLSYDDSFSEESELYYDGFEIETDSTL